MLLVVVLLIGQQRQIDEKRLFMPKNASPQSWRDFDLAAIGVPQKLQALGFSRAAGAPSQLFQSLLHLEVRLAFFCGVQQFSAVPVCQSNVAGITTVPAMSAIHWDELDRLDKPVL